MFCWEVGLQLYVEKLLPGEEAHLVEYFLERVSGGRAAPFFHSTLLAMSASSSSWRFTFYLIAFIAGTAVIVDVSGDYLGRASGGVGSLARWPASFFDLAGKCPYHIPKTNLMELTYIHPSCMLL